MDEPVPTNRSKIITTRGEVNVVLTVEEVLQYLLEAAAMGSRVAFLAMMQASGGEERGVLVNAQHIVSVEYL